MRANRAYPRSSSRTRFLSRPGIGDLERGRRQAPRPETVRMLADALGLSPQERTALLAAARPAVFHSGAPPARQASRFLLPVPLTRLIGREQELRALWAVLQDDVRLVTVTGVGGSGKTRLAVAVAADVAAHYADGVVFIDLSSLTDPARCSPRSPRPSASGSRPTGPSSFPGRHPRPHSAAAGPGQLRAGAGGRC